MTGITDADTLETFRKEYVKEADQHMTASTVLFPETEEVLRALKANGTRIGHHLHQVPLPHHGADGGKKYSPEGFIDIIVGGEDVKEAKPSPEGLLQAASPPELVPKSRFSISATAPSMRKPPKMQELTLPVSFTE